MRKVLCCFSVMIALMSSQAFAGSFSALAGADGQHDDAQTSLIYDAGLGTLGVNPPVGVELTSINISSAGSAFIGDKPGILDGAFDNFAADNIFKATFGSSFGGVSFGQVLASGLSADAVVADLTAVGSLAGGGDLGAVDLIYIPEPASIALLGLGFVGLLGFARRRAR